MFFLLNNLISLQIHTFSPQNIKDICVCRKKVVTLSRFYACMCTSEKNKLNMKLSIITINYNNAEGLRMTLASVAAQTYANIEHIIIDGGSTDGSVEIIREYADNQAKGERLEAKGTENSKADTPASTLYTLHHTPSAHKVTWLSEPDKGIYNAMNKGIEIALGKRVVNSLNRSVLVEDKNKGIEIALGKRVVNDDHTSSPLASSLSPLASQEYIQILNSGDILAAPDVTERMFQAMGNGQWAIENETNRQSPIALKFQFCMAT